MSQIPKQEPEESSSLFEDSDCLGHFQVADANEETVQRKEVCTLYAYEEKEYEKFSPRSTSSRELNTISELTETDSSTNEHKVIKDEEVSFYDDDANQESDEKLEEDTTPPQFLTLTCNNRDEQEENNAANIPCEGEECLDTAKNNAPENSSLKSQELPCENEDITVLKNDAECICEQLPEDDIEVNDCMCNQSVNTLLTFEVTPENLNETIDESKFIQQPENNNTNTNKIINITDVGVQINGITLSDTGASVSSNETKPFDVGSIQSADCKRLSIQNLPPVSVRTGLVVQKLTSIDIVSDNQTASLCERPNIHYEEVKAHAEEQPKEKRERSSDEYPIAERKVSWYVSDKFIRPPSNDTKTDEKQHKVEEKNVSDESMQTNEVPQVTEETQCVTDEVPVVVKNVVKEEKPKDESNDQKKEEPPIPSKETPRRRDRSPSISGKPTINMSTLKRISLGQCMLMAEDDERRNIVYTSYQVVPQSLPPKSEEEQISTKISEFSQMDESVYKTFIDPKGTKTKASDKVVCLMPDKEEFVSDITIVQASSPEITLSATREDLKRHEKYDILSTGGPDTSYTPSTANSVKEFDKVLSVLNEVIKYTANASDSEGSTAKGAPIVKIPKNFYTDKETQCHLSKHASKTTMFLNEADLSAEQKYFLDDANDELQIEESSKESLSNSIDDYIQNINQPQIAAEENDIDSYLKVKFTDTDDKPVLERSSPPVDQQKLEIAEPTLEKRTVKEIHQSPIITTPLIQEKVKEVVKISPVTEYENKNMESDSFLTLSTMEEATSLGELCAIEREDKQKRVCCQIFKKKPKPSQKRQPPAVDKKSTPDKIENVTETAIQTSLTTSDLTTSTSSSSESSDSSKDKISQSSKDIIFQSSKDRISQSSNDRISQPPKDRISQPPTEKIVQSSKDFSHTENQLKKSIYEAEKLSTETKKENKSRTEEFKQKLNEPQAKAFGSENDVVSALRKEIKETALKQQDSIQQYFVPSPAAIKDIQRRSVYFVKKKAEALSGDEEGGNTSTTGKVNETDEEQDNETETTAMVVKVIHNNPLRNKIIGNTTCSKYNDDLIPLLERNTPAGDTFDYRDYLKVHPNGRYEDEANNFCRLCVPQIEATPRRITKLPAKKIYTDNTTSETSSETLSEGEIRCKCKVSLGEIHRCPYAAKPSVEYLKNNPEELIRCELRNPDLQIQRQRTFNSNWIAYYISKP